MSDLRHVLGLLELDRWRVVRAVLVASLTLASPAALGISRGAVKSHSSRALHSLRSAMEANR